MDEPKCACSQESGRPSLSLSALPSLRELAEIARDRDDDEGPRDDDEGEAGDGG